MAKAAEQLKTQLRQLSSEERADLAYFLLESLGPDEDEGGAAWNAEISRRVAEIRAGRATGKSAEQLFAELRAEAS